MAPLSDSQIDEILDEQRSVALRLLFPQLATDLPLVAMNLGVRMQNALARAGYASFSDIADISVAGLLDVPAVGLGSVREALFGFSVQASRDVAEVGVAAISEDQPPAPWAPLLDDIQLVSRWLRLLGREELPLRSVPDDLSEPEAVGRARQRLIDATARDVLGVTSDAGPAAELIRAITGDIADRDLEILRDRLFADTPQTLDQIGARWGVTRERARQIEVKTKAMLTERIADSDLSDFVAAVRSSIGRVLPLRTLIQRFPSLADNVATFDLPVWRILDRLDDSFEIADSWCAIGTVAGAMAETREAVKEEADSFGAADIRNLAPDIAPDESWLRFAGVSVVAGYAVVGNANIPTRAAIVLRVAGAPMESDDIHATLGSERSITSLKNALAADSRFTRVDRSKWALASWGHEGYSSIRELIGREIDRAGGQITFKLLAATLTQKFDVAAGSIMTYSSAHPYIMDRGIVRRRVRRDLRKVRGKGLTQTRGMFRVGDEISVRIIVNEEHLRGSGSPMPTALGEELDLSRNEVRSLSTVEGGEVALSWRGPQITLGSVRDEVRALSLEVGTPAFVIFGPDQSIAIVPDAPAEDVTAALATATGGSFTEGAPVARQVAERIDMPDGTEAEVVAKLRARGDAEIAELLTAVIDEALVATGN